MSTLEGNNTQQQKLMAGKQYNASTNRKFGNDISNKTLKVAAGNAKKKNTTATSTAQRKPLANAANRERKGDNRNGIAAASSIAAPDSLANLPGSTKSVASSKCDKSTKTTLATAPKPKNHPGLQYQYTGPVDDIDKREKDDPLMVTAYVQGMYEHNREQRATHVRQTHGHGESASSQQDDSGHPN